MSGLGPQDSAIPVDAELEAAIKTSDFEAIKGLMRQKAEEAGLITRDIYSGDPIPVDQPAPKKHAVVLTIRGKKHVVEANSPDELKTAEIALLERELGASQESQQSEQSTEHPRGDDGRFQNREDGEAQAAPDAGEQQRTLELHELETKFRLGQIDTATYLRDSGALDEYLSSKGIDVNAVAQERANEEWSSAVETFLNSEAGSTWPGGADNLRVAQEIAEQNPHLADYPDKVQALAEIYEFMKANNLVKENPALTAHKKLASAQTQEELNDALNAFRPSGSGMWNR
jgi:hypothetical protein